ncbi:MAG: hypothetical protein HC849_23955 [Oscillatoriales cyanobacterium RU_3_3]|nr:hypothetical protein [Oscillatoriales cyanobacterium RU_3_3]NJR22085.1 hypothetical protein [Richelia sp. CSU_2_1]
MVFGIIAVFCAVTIARSNPIRRPSDNAGHNNAVSLGQNLRVRSNPMLSHKNQIRRGFKPPFHSQSRAPL